MRPHRALRGAGRAPAALVALALLVACTPTGEEADGPTPAIDAPTDVTSTASTVDARGGDPIDPAPPGDARIAEVERVVDGDTVIVDVDGARERVRLLRIDTPELARDGDPAECLADEAAGALAALLPPGEPVLLATDVEARDRFGRLLAHVWTATTWVNAEMLRSGYAQVVTVPPNTAFDDEVLAAQGRARDAGRGLWSPSAC